MKNTNEREEKNWSSTEYFTVALKVFGIDKL